MALSPPRSQNGEILDRGPFAHCDISDGQHLPGQCMDECVNNQSRYNSPAPTSDDMRDYSGYNAIQNMTFQPSYQHQKFSPDTPQAKYSGQYYSQVYPIYSTPLPSPPTLATDNRDVLLRGDKTTISTSHQFIQPLPEGHSRVDRTFQTKRNSRGNPKVVKKMIKLERPLSELTELAHIPLADIEAHVFRSKDERLKEAATTKNLDYVKRPMNSFILYRKAYQNRLKLICGNDNQIISKHCGASWRYESQDVKKKFEKWATIDRVNHFNAFPDYKFSPSKSKTPKSSKKKSPKKAPRNPDAEYQNIIQSSPQAVQRHSTQTDSTHLDRKPVATSDERLQSREASTEPGSFHRSSFQANNPHRQPPQLYNSTALELGHYDQQTVQTSHQGGVEDVIIKKQCSPDAQTYLSPSPQGSQEYELSSTGSYNPYNMHNVGGNEHRIDPYLLAPGQMASFPGDQFATMQQRLQGIGRYTANIHDGLPHWRGSMDTSDPSINLLSVPRRADSFLPFENTSMQVFRGPHDVWTEDSLDPGPEFDQWMEHS